MKKISLGLNDVLFKDQINRQFFTNLKSEIGDHLADVHFAHYNLAEISSGRTSSFYPNKREIMLNAVETMSELDIKSSLLINYLLHDNLNAVIKILKRDYIPRGLNSVVVANPELVKMIKQEFPDLYIQGSCLSYRLTAEELEEERQAGVELHNPISNIIRDVNNLKRNHELGYKQKILPLEGCLNSCISEKKEGAVGHRWAVARGVEFQHTFNCISFVEKNLRYFLKANWITLDRLRSLEEYIDIIKIPRSTVEDIDGADIGKFIYNVKNFIYRYENDVHEYNILDYLGTIYKGYLKKRFGYIPSSLFTNEFFDHIETCDVNKPCEICDGLVAELEKLEHI